MTLEKPALQSRDSLTWLLCVSPDWNANPRRAGLVICFVCCCISSPWNVFRYTAVAQHNGWIKENDGLHGEEDGKIHAGI